MRLRTGFGAAAAALVAAAIAAACTDLSRSPIGVDLPPGGVLEGGLEVLDLRGFVRATDYEVFPSERGEADRLPVAHDWPAPPGFESRALARFSLEALDSLPDATEVLSGTLRLRYPTPAAPITVRVHRVTSAWTEDAATWVRRDFGAAWATPGGDFAPEPVATFTIGPEQPDSVRVPLPGALVAGWIDGTTPNHGLILIQETPGPKVEFASSEAVSGNGPALLVEVQIPGAGLPIGLTALDAREDTFIALDDDPIPSDPGILVSAAEPVRRGFLEPSLADLPAGSTIAVARLILTIDRVRVPADSLRIVAVQAASEFLGEKTVLDPISASSILGLETLTPATQPGDTVIFEGTRLVRLVRAWLEDPEENRGIGLRMLEEETGFGSVRFHGPEAPLALRPRLKVIRIPAPVTTGAP